MLAEKYSINKKVVKQRKRIIKETGQDGTCERVLER